MLFFLNPFKTIKQQYVMFAFSILGVIKVEHDTITEYNRLAKYHLIKFT